MMAYIPLSLPSNIPEVVGAMIRQGVEPFLFDVHWMLAAAYPETGPKRQFQLAITLTLLAAAAGVSAQLYQVKDNAGTGNRFRECLLKFYPWDIDPPEGASPEKAAETLYEVYRNPLVHYLGVDHHRRYKVKIGRILGGSDDAENNVERLERLHG